MKKKLLVALALIAIIELSGCSESSSLEEGTFIPYFQGVKTDITPLTIYKDGTGHDDSLDSDFNWGTSGKKLHITPVDSRDGGGGIYKWSDENALECKSGYIVMSESAFSGKIPKGDTFDTTISNTSYNFHFSPDGTLIVSDKDNQGNPESYTYTREGDFIITDYQEYMEEPAHFLVIDSTLYANYYCPESKLPENL